MPSYLNFTSTKEFRDSILSRTLRQPNGPQTFTSANYEIRSLRNMPNVNPGDVDDNRVEMLGLPRGNNIYKPINFSVTDNLRVLPRRANLNLYPYFSLQAHNLISVYNQRNLDRESELMKFAGTFLASREGPVLSRITRNLERETNGRLRLLDALNGSISTASNIITGREPLIAPNYSITVSKTLPGKIVDFLLVAAGIETPFSDIPGDYLTEPRNPINFRPVANTQLGTVLQDVTGVLGSLIGIQRRPTPSRKPSDLFIDHMGGGQKNTLFDLLSFSTYAPNYTKSARSQNTSKIFNFVENAAQGVRNLLGTDAPPGVAYIGDDRGNDVKFAMNDFNGIPVRSNYYLSLMFDPIQAQLFERKSNYSEGGSVAGKLTWISRNSKNQLGVNNSEWGLQQSDFIPTTSTSFGFRDESILGYTQDILDSLPTNGKESRSHVANVIDQTSRIFREGDVMISRGSAVQYVDKYGEESGVEYCRVWTKDRAYLNLSDTMKRQQNVRKYDDSVLDRSWNLNIAPMSNGGRNFDGSTNILPNGNGFYAKKYMFSIENLAWKTSTTPGFSVDSLPFCERGNNGGRVMWFPPYDLKMSEQNSAKWDENVFLGRPEPIYTYQNTSRSGQISFKIVVDHPSILNLLVKEHFKGMSDDESENYINSFFAGCEEIDFYDLITRYKTITPEDAKLVSDYLNKKVETITIEKFNNTVPNVVKKQPVITSPNDIVVKESLDVSLNFANAFPTILNKDEYKGIKYSELFKSQINSSVWTGETINNLETVLKEIISGTTTSNTANAKHDKQLIFGKTDIPIGESTKYLNIVKDDLIKEITSAQTSFTTYNDKLSLLKTDIESGLIKDIKISINSSTSALADNNFNYKLSIRRSYSILLETLDRLCKGVDSKALLDSKWPKTFNGGPKTTANEKIDFTLKEMGHESLEGKLSFDTYSDGENYVNERFQNCSTQEFKYVSGPNSLRVSSPVAFGCRQSTVRLNYERITKQEPQKPTPDPILMTGIPDKTTETIVKPNRPPIDPMKRIIMKTLSECYYFQKLEESDPVVFKSLKEKLKYFHPAFHSTTPEGLNSRLTFLQQCIRPGDTIPIKGLSDLSDLNARNTSFGPPPICVLRIGDFYHSKVIIRDVNITFDDSTWDLNPEGIGVQPMIANVTLQINFIGGHGLSKPVERLQNALSSNFYANTEMYDERSISSKDLRIDNMSASGFTENFLQGLGFPKNITEGSTNNNSGDNSTGIFIGLGTTSLSYGSLIDKTYEITKKYFDTYESLYNNVVGEYGRSISSFILHPNYREINEYDIFNATSSTAGLTINLFGECSRSRVLSGYVTTLKTNMTERLTNSSTNISQMLGLDGILSLPKQIKTNEILLPYLTTIIDTKLTTITDNKQLSTFIDVRNDVIKTFDQTNFIVKYGFDAKVVGSVVTKGTLSGFTYNLLYDQYENCVDNFVENANKLYEDLDTTINFSSPNITTDVLSELLSVLLKEEDKTDFLEVFSVDTTIFDQSTLRKIGNRFDSFLTKPSKEYNFKFKKLKKRKSEKEISFVKTDSEITDSIIKGDVTKSRIGSPLVTGKKLNNYRP